MNPFKGRHFQRNVILWAVRWDCKYGISYRELLAERGVNVDPPPLPQGSALCAGDRETTTPVLASAFRLLFMASR